MSFWRGRALSGVCIRRVKSKSMLDPFAPEKKEDVARLARACYTTSTKTSLRMSKQGAGDKLDQSADLFTGEVWLARRAHELGLIDGVAHLKPKTAGTVWRQGEVPPLWRKANRSGRGSVPALAQDAVAGLEERAAYARFGL